MKIGILGSGVVGQALCKGFVERGDEVAIGSRTPDKLSSFVSKLEGAYAATFDEVVNNSELIVMATLWDGTLSAISMVDKANFSGKIVIDATNPLKASGDGEPPELSIGTDDSAGETIARSLPDAHIVKAFNTVGNAHMYKPMFSQQPSMFYCGNDLKSKKIVSKILEDFGWEPIDVGNITASRQLEAMCILWVKYGFASQSWNHAFKLLRS